MSWSASGKAKRIDGKLLFDLHESRQGGYAEEESIMALANSKRVVSELLESRILGDGEFLVIISGHSNPNGEPGKNSNWPRDYVAIRIENVEIPVPEPFKGEEIQAK